MESEPEPQAESESDGLWSLEDLLRRSRSVLQADLVLARYTVTASSNTSHLDPH